MPLLFNSHWEAIVGLGPIPDHVLNMRPGASTNSDGYALLLDTLGLGTSSYSMCLKQASGSPGFLIWNDNSPSRMAQAFTKLTVQDTGYWMVKMEDLRIGNKSIACSEGCGAILDSGTSLISMPNDVKTEMELGIATKAWDCARMQELPDMSFKLDGVEHSLPPDSYLAKITGKAPKGIEKALDTYSNGTKRNRVGAACEVALMQVAMSSSLGRTFILGMPFFRSYYVTFSQRSKHRPPEIFTAQADQNCYPMSSKGETSSLHTTRRSVTARSLDASKVRMPPWLQKASISGRLEETVGRPSGTHLFATAAIGAQGTLTGLGELTAVNAVD